MSHLTEQQKETVLNAQYAIKTALAELSEFNHLKTELQTIGGDCVALIEEVNKATSSLRSAKVLADKLVSDMEGKSRGTTEVRIT